MSPSIVDDLLRRRSQFLSFVRGQVADAAAADDILQAAYEKALAAFTTLHSDESADAWFYRILRNTIIDHHRRNAASRKAAEQLAREPDEEAVPARRVCGCAFKLLPRLHGDYAEMIRAVDVDGRAVEEVAAQLGISANNASVRLHRARRALREKLLEFCVDCCSGNSAAGCHDCYCHLQV